jgi:hypothetical protein
VSLKTSFGAKRRKKPFYTTSQKNNLPPQAANDAQSHGATPPGSAEAPKQRPEEKVFCNPPAGKLKLVRSKHYLCG